jgi:hypothetical protein
MPLGNMKYSHHVGLEANPPLVHTLPRKVGNPTMVFGFEQTFDCHLLSVYTQVQKLELLKESL